MYRVWFVDDLAKNRRAWLRSFSLELQEAHEFLTFESVEDLFYVLDGGEWPDILFIDYYIGLRHGHEVVTYFQEASARPLLIGHSSMEGANLKMLSLGADLYFPKDPSAARNAFLMRHIQSTSDLEALIRRKKQTPAENHVNG